MADKIVSDVKKEYFLYSYKDFKKDRHCSNFSNYSQ